ncbi:MFS transporter [Streptomyces sp. NPDC048231]|uniref:MFS transporter n=1 Tax=Streptomyces sp. NPDC048231 TaxID=3365519 RepID=UPI00371305B1
MLFRPLVLVPVALSARGSPDLTAGLVLTALLAGLALAATDGDRLLPHRFPDHARCLAEAGVFTLAVAGLLAVPQTVGWLVLLLALTGLGLGMVTPAHNATIMGAIPARSSGTGGGLVNMTGGLGTALGVAQVTLALYVADSDGNPDREPLGRRRPGGSVGRRGGGGVAEPRQTDRNRRRWPCDGGPEGIRNAAEWVRLSSPSPPSTTRRYRRRWPSWRRRGRTRWTPTPSTGSSPSRARRSASGGGRRRPTASRPREEPDRRTVAP